MALIPTPPASFHHSEDSDTSANEYSRGRTLQRGRRQPNHAGKRTRTAMEEAASTDMSGQISDKRQRLSETHTPTFSPSSSLSRGPSLPRRRSASPTKTQSISLETTGVPRVKMGSGAVGNTEDRDTQQLYTRLQTATDRPVIPHEFMDLIGGDEIIRPSCVCPPREQAQSASTRRLWTRIRLIRSRARRSEMLRDESSWTDVVKLVLATALHGCDEEEEARSGALQVINLQTQSIAEDYLPTISIPPGYCNRRTDLALGVDEPLEDTLAAQLRERASKCSRPLNHMKDLELQRIYLALPIEIKAKNGNTEEAQLQLAVYFAAVSVFLDKACPDPTAQVPPMLGWMVLGPSWTLVLAWRDGKGVVHVRQLNALGSCGTSDFESLFRLLAILKECIDWVKQDYQPKYLSLMKQYLGTDVDS